ncbi:hypothetical protein ARMGADRAFT_1027587 [Armillaria gallica]|uniref:Uncharacterized protein n=1 Tax=Armillaria gallica TaxID=47427 RepID=A0A2H3E099_ARMGA|nr:hypothetical protein ARMGADRAFT_1027587 [Armillaria gallica]
MIKSKGAMCYNTVRKPELDALFLGNVPAGECVDANISDANNTDYAMQEYHLSPNDVRNFTSMRNAADVMDVSASSYNVNLLPINKNIFLVGSSTQVYGGRGLEYSQGLYTI